jgi:hypothetical protein
MLVSDLLTGHDNPWVSNLHPLDEEAVGSLVQHTARGQRNARGPRIRSGIPLAAGRARERIESP